MKPFPQHTTPAYQVTALDNFDFYESSGVLAKGLDGSPYTLHCKANSLF